MIIKFLCYPTKSNLAQLRLPIVFLFHDSGLINIILVILLITFHFEEFFPISNPTLLFYAGHNFELVKESYSSHEK